MIVLALDTAITGCSACLLNGGDSFHERLDTDRGQAEFLVPLIDEIIWKSALSYDRIDRIAVTTGPGSFTGVRIGLSTAKALALSQNKPLLGFTTFEVIARAHDILTDTLVLFDTKRGDFYGQIFGAGGVALSQPEIWSEDKMQASGLDILRDIVPDSRIIARMAKESLFNERTYDPLTAPTPLYLRGAEVSQSKRIAPRIIST